MKQVKRFDLETEPVQKIKLPYNSEILYLGVIGNKPCLWVVCDPKQNMITRTFVMAVQDKDLSERANKTNYIGSFNYEAEVGSQIIHIFEE